MYDANMPYVINDTNYQIQMKIVMFKMFLSRGFKPPYLRSFQIDSVWSTIDKIEKVVNNPMRTGLRLKPTLLSSEVPSVIIPDKNPHKIAEIPNGWEEKRYIFIMAVEYQRPGSNWTNTEYIQGFTDYDGYIVGQDRRPHFDDRMVFRVNSIITMSRGVDPHTGNPVSSMVSNYSVADNRWTVMSDHRQPGNKPSLTDQYVIGRPVDVVNSIRQVDLYDDYTRRINDTNILNQPQLSKREDSIPTIHVADTLSSVIAGKASAVMTDTYGDLMDQAAGTLSQDSSLFESMFLKTISMLSGWEESSTFTTTMLKTIDPSINGRIEVYRSRQGSATVLQSTDNGEDHYKPTIENMLSKVVHDSLAAYMATCCISSMVVNITNITGTREFVITAPPNTFIPDNVNIMYLADIVKERFITEVFNTITYGNQMRVSIVAYMDLIGGSKIDISVDGNPFVIVDYPTYADASFSSIIFAPNDFANVADDYNGLINAVSGIPYNR